ncbi:MAG: hypothetical protein Kow0098_07150 [Ignavibacteriaceae bacterium]
MKKIQKIFLPLLILAAFYLIYTFYFAPKDELGLFSSFDPNNSAVRDIRVAVVHEKGLNQVPMGGATFYAADRNNVQVQVNADKVTGDLSNAKVVVLWGHLSSGGTFHAHNVIVE